MSNLLALLCGDFAKLVLIALLVGTPVAYFIAHAFLSQYVFRTEINLWVFGITGFGILLIAILTVVFQSLKAAITNPVNSLRTE